MATTWTHAIFALAAGKTAVHRKVPLRFWLMTAICATLPDMDVFWRGLVSDRSGIWSHRGITHSLPAAVVLGLLAALISRNWRRAPNNGIDTPEGAEHPAPTKTFFLLWLAFTLATASHLFLDMLSSGYRGVALLAPFDAHRYSFPWQPIWNVPHWVEEMFPSLMGRSVRRSWLIRATLDEIVVVWLPMAMLVLFSRLVHRRKKEPALVKVKA